MAFLALFHFFTLRNVVHHPLARDVRNQRGQGLIEYLVIVAIMGVATIGIVRVMGQTVSSRFANITLSLQGKSPSAKSDSVSASLYKKKDLGNFFKGADGRNSSQTQDSEINTEDSGFGQ